MIDLAVFLKRNGYRPDQVQDFIPAPFDIATCMYYTGIDPFTGQEVYVAKAPARPQAAAGPACSSSSPRTTSRCARPLLQAGRSDLIGYGLRLPDPGSAAEGGDRGAEATGERRRDHYHSVANPAKGEPAGERGLPNQGYRPGRRTARRQDKKRERNGG